jgi:hypothetical protein
LVVEGDNVKDTFATIPFEMAVELRPHKAHLMVPGPLLQEIDLFAEVATVPTLTVADEKSICE